MEEDICDAASQCSAFLDSLLQRDLLLSQYRRGASSSRPPPSKFTRGSSRSLQILYAVLVWSRLAQGKKVVLDGRAAVTPRASNAAVLSAVYIWNAGSMPLVRRARRLKSARRLNRLPAPVPHQARLPCRRCSVPIDANGRRRCPQAAVGVGQYGSGTTQLQALVVF